MAMDGGTPGLVAPTAEEWRSDGPEFLRVVWRERADHPLLVRDVVGAVWNVDLLYDFTLLLLNPRYSQVSFTEPATELLQQIEPDDRLGLIVLEHHSPLLFIAAIPLVAAGAAAVWALTQSFEKIANLGLKRRLLKANVAKAEAEARIAAVNAQLYENALQSRGAEEVAGVLRRRFEESALQVVEAELLDQNPAA
jgi:hypothetical protein